MSKEDRSKTTILDFILKTRKMGKQSRGQWNWKWKSNRKISANSKVGSFKDQQNW